MFDKIRVTTARRAPAALLAGVLSVLGAAPALASPLYIYQDTLQIPGATSDKPFTGYDLAIFDQSTQLYYLTDRSNNGIDVFSSATNKFVERIGQGVFAGGKGGNNDIAGPNGISISNVGTGKLLIAGDGNSNLRTFTLDTTGLTVQSTANFTTAIASGPNATPTPANRVDGVAYAPGAKTILAANNAANPGFITLLNAADGTIVKSIKLDGSNGYPDVAGFGVEATIYNTARKSFFVAVPSLTSDGLGAGGAIELDAATGALLHTYDFNALGLAGACSPTGLVQGSGAVMFIACSDPKATGSVLLDPAGAGSIKVVPGIRGGDQTAYDPGINTFFEAARFQPGGPVLGIVDGLTGALQTLPIGSNDHSVAVDPVTGEVYVATGPTTTIANCANGCVAVFAQVPEPSSLPLFAMALTGLGVATWCRRRA